ncbi:MAG: hypothetical protein GY711_15880 [bacterium]|nr:hypothetical protein [bacterium]
MRRDLILYVLLPAVIGAALLAAYFSGVDSWMSAVAPPANREYGALENLQNLVLLLAAWTAWRASRGVAGRARAIWTVVAVGSLFVLLEELDFGLHYYESLAGVEESERAEVRNLHNQYGASHYLKRVVDPAMGVFFLVLPLVALRKGRAGWRRFVPHVLSPLTLLLSVAVSKTAHFGEDAWSHNDALRSNLSEFRELFVYYLWFLYFRYMAERRGEPSEGV